MSSLRPRLQTIVVVPMLLVAALLANVGNARAVEFIAHRGESHDAPENTLAAFRLAWETGVRAVELDVHLSKDDRLVVIHDADTKRTAGQKRIVKDSSYDELRDIDVGAWKHKKFTGEKLVTLEDALPLVPPGCRYFIEVKVGPESVPALVRAIEQCGKSPEQLCVISFKAKTIAETKKRLPHVKAYYLHGFKKDKTTNQWKPSIDELIAEAKSINADGLDLSYEGPLNAEMVKKVKAAGLELYLYTIDDAKVAKKFAKMGVDGITTNRAAWLQQQLESAAKPK